MNWQVFTYSVWFLAFYLLWTCMSAYRIASYESGLAIKVPDSVRVALLIFYFKRSKISVLAVVYQIYTYFMLGLFLLSRFGWMQSFLIQNFPNANQVYTWALEIQIFGLFLVAMGEEGIYYLRTRNKIKL